MPSRRVVVIGLTASMSIVLLGDRLQALRQAGFDVHIAVGDSFSCGIPATTGTTVHHIPMSRSISPWRDLRALLGWLRLLRILRPVAVVGATPKGAMLALLSAKLARVPVRVFEVWGAAWEGVTGYRGALLRLADRMSLNCSTAVIAVSPSLADLLVSTRMCVERPTVLGAGGSKGVRLDVFRPLKEAKEFTAPSVGFIGRVAHDKGADVIPGVMTAIRERLPGARLVIIGDLDETDPPNDWTRTFLSTDSLTTLTGWVMDPSAAICELDVLLFPSRREGLPNAVIEAAACGVPTVAFDATGTRNVVVDGETGYLVEMGDTSALVDCLIRLLSSQDLRSSMASASVRFARENFDSRCIDAMHVDHLRSLIGDRLG